MYVRSRPYERLHCRKDFASKLSRKSHIRPTPISFGVINASKRCELNRHIEHHLNIRNFDCELCEKRFYYEHHLELHTPTRYPLSAMFTKNDSLGIMLCGNIWIYTKAWKNMCGKTYVLRYCTLKKRLTRDKYGENCVRNKSLKFKVLSGFIANFDI